MFASLILLSPGLPGGGPPPQLGGVACPVTLVGHFHRLLRTPRDPAETPGV